MERGMAQLQVHLTNLQTLLGRLEALTGSLSAGGGPEMRTHLSPAQPPIEDDPEAQKLADEYLERRKAELDDQIANLGAEDG